MGLASKIALRHAICMFYRLAALFALFFAALLPAPALADAADIDAAARGVVRVVLVRDEEGNVRPSSHGSGFAVTPNMIVTNAHVVRDAVLDDTLRIGIVPSEQARNGEPGAFGRIVAVSPRNDLALIEIAEGSLKLPPVTFAGGVAGNMGEVSAVGYPMNVDLAQGLEIDDIFRPQPPVKSRGFLSGERPSRQFDTILHTAPIARGNSGGPLLDGCGRVLGVNSFGADSDGSDAEFYFAVSLRELLPFLRDNNIDPRTNASPCRSIDELNAAELARFEAERADAQARIDAREEELREARQQAWIKAQMQMMEERENAIVTTMLLLIAGLIAAYTAAQLRKDESRRKFAIMAAGAAGAAFIACILVWLARPSSADIEDRVAAILKENGDGEDGATTPDLSAAGDGTLICTLVPERSRVTGARTDDIEFDWSATGCVNGRTQYGMDGGTWSRVFVPNDEAAVSVNSYDPESRTFRTDRYLLGRADMEAAREARRSYSPPACGVTDAARLLGERQSAVIAQLPERENERLVYSCEPKPASGNPAVAEAEE
ncbi:serine protease [Erythrobacter sp. YT30]|uniref:S1 family peptidase n=1 Tax=Erythrobacter sp. YT30 TaxID=1735012 RepID=UPI0009ECA336|nr:serine protease [Erythrobacter sp. YT30]